MDKFKISVVLGPRTPEEVNMDPKLRKPGVMELPYERSFTYFGELFVIHRPATIMHKPAKRGWRCSHYRTGRSVHYEDHNETEDINECEEQAKAYLAKTGKAKLLEKVKECEIINEGGGLVLNSLFDEDEAHEKDYS